jgi:hypothetical protein
VCVRCASTEGASGAVRSCAYVGAMGHLQCDAARHLLADSRLRVNLDDYWREDTGGVDWGRLMDERGHSGSEVALITICECLIEGALGHATCLDQLNWAVLREALEILEDRPRPRPHLRAA